MKKRFQLVGVLLGGLLLAAATVYGYSVVYLYASQPENYGQLRFKVYAWICIISFFLVIILTLWAVVKVLTRQAKATLGSTR